MKQNKFLISICLLFFSVNLLAQKASKVIVSGKLKNFNNRTTLLSLSEVERLRLPNSEREIVPDNEGNFKLSFNLKAPGYFRIGRNELYLTPGDQLRVEVDNNAPLQSKFEGKTSAIQRYLSSSPLQKGGSYLDGGNNIKANLPESIQFILELAKKKADLLATLQKTPSGFIRLEKARNKADIIFSLMRLPGLYIYINKIQGPQKKDSIFAKADSLTSPIVKKLIPELADSRYLAIETFQHVTYRITEQTDKPEDPEIAHIKDWQAAEQLSRVINATDNKEQLAAINLKIGLIKNAVYRNALLESYRIKSKFSNGDSAIDFEMIDKDGNKKKLSDYKGKVIFIDLWATWCMPCLEEMPALAKLRSKYVDHKDIVFLSVCINDIKNIWKNYIIKNSYPGIQLFAEQFQMRDYSVISLPRSVIIDKSFKVKLLDGPLPSNPALTDYLNNLIK